MSASPALKATPAGVWSSPSTVTVNADDDGGAPAVSSAPSKVTVSAAPSTDALLNAGGVLLVTVFSPKSSAALPAWSRTRSRPGSLRYSYLTVTDWCSWVTALASVPVTVRPDTWNSEPILKPGIL